MWLDEIQKTLPKTEAEIAAEQVEQADRDLEEIKYSDRKDVKTFKNGKNAKGEFIANILIDLTDSNSKWWTGRHNHAILGMSKTDDTEFRQFHQEIEKRTKDMDEYGEADNPIVEDSFIVQDGNGKEYVYVVKLDGYLHGVVLEKIDFARHVQAMKKYERGKPYGRSYADIGRRTANARNEMERHSVGDSGNLASVGNSGHGGLGGTSPKIDMAGNNGGEGSTNRKTPAVTDANGQPAHSDRATESVSNRSLLANAFEVLVQNDIERKRLQEYKDKIGLINAEEQKLRKLNEQIKELSFAKGPRDTKAIRDLQDEATKTANRINIYDTQLAYRINLQLLP